MKHIKFAAIALIAVCCAEAHAAPAGACETRDFGFDLKDAGWRHQPLSKLKRDTVHTVIKDGEYSVLRADAKGSASLFVTGIQPAVSAPATLTWRWKTDALVPGADNRNKKLEDAPLRVLVAFDGDPATLSEEEQKRSRKAKSLSGRTPPYALLMYIWSDHVAPETVIPSAHTSQIKMLVLASGSAGLGSWQTVRRNPTDDYRKAFGAEAGKVTGLGVMTDTDNTGEKAVGYYSGLRFECNS